jgi:uncharacterized protein YlxW (UPF0749 family)
VFKPFCTKLICTLVFKILTTQKLFMKKLGFLLMLVCLAIAPTLSHAQDTTKANKKADMRKALRDKWQNATPEEKDKMKAKMKEVKAKYDSLPPEKKAEIKEKMKERKEAKKP